MFMFPNRSMSTEAAVDSLRKRRLLAWARALCLCRADLPLRDRLGSRALLVPVPCGCRWRQTLFIGLLKLFPPTLSAQPQAEQSRPTQMGTLEQSRG